jgi:L-asparaginase II
MSTPPTSVVLAEVVRSGFVEGCHRGSLVVLAADGSVELSLGSPGLPVFPRSSNKPMQATAILRTGLDLDGELLALAAASHSAETFHLDGVCRAPGPASAPGPCRLPPPGPWTRPRRRRGYAPAATPSPS